VTQQFYKNMALWVVILLMILLLVTMLRQGQVAPTDVPFSKFLAQVEAGEVAAVTIEQGRIGLLDALVYHPRRESRYCDPLERPRRPGPLR